LPQQRAFHCQLTERAIYGHRVKINHDDLKLYMGSRATAALPFRMSRDKRSRIQYKISSSSMPDPSQSIDAMNDNEHAKKLVANGEALLLRHLSGAAAEFDRAIAIDPRNVAALRARAFIRLEAAYNAEAIADLDRAIEIDPADPASWRARGDAYREDDQPDRAIANYSEAIRLAPHMPEFYDRRASAYLFTGRLKDAIADYDEMTRLAPGDPVPHQRRGYLYVNTGNHEQALSEFAQAISLAPTSEHYCQRGAAYQKMGDHVAALADFNEAIRIDPNSSDAYDARRRMWTALGDRTRADADYDESLRLASIRSWSSDCSSAMGFEREHDRERAVASFERALVNFEAVVRMFPRDARLLCRRGFLRLKLGNEAGAKEDFSLAKALSPSITEIIEALSEDFDVRDNVQELLRG